MKNLDSIFDLNCPAILNYDVDVYENNKIIIKDREELLTKDLLVNGGVLLFKPSINIYKETIKNIKKIIENNCKYPNETLFVYTMKNLYNLPIIYNLSHYFVSKYKHLKNQVFIYHFNSSQYKPLDYIKDNYISKAKNKIEIEILLFYKKKYYNKLNKIVNNLINKI